MSARAELRLRIRECTACNLAAQCTAPVPFRGPAPAAYAVVGEAPGRVEDGRGQPFVGPAGQLLDQYLIKAGLDPADAFICNTVSCFPALTRTPKEKHVEACKHNLRDQLTLAEAPYVLVLGAVALSAFRPGESIMKLHGSSWTVSDPPVSLTLFFTYHPALILRDRSLTRAWRLDLEEFARMVNQ